MKIREFLDAYFKYCTYQKGLDRKTIKAYRIDLRQFLEFVGMDLPDRKKIEEYIAYLHKKYWESTAKRKVASVRAFFSYLERKEIIAESPFRKIEVKFRETQTLPRVISKKEMELLLNYMYQFLEEDCTPYWEYSLRDVAVVEALFATGARVYEISNIPADGIDLDTGVVRLMGKGKKERYVQIGNASVLALLKKYYGEHQDAILESGYFFVNNRWNRYSEQSIRQMVKKYTRLAGINRNITPHMFRHTVATSLIEEGVDVSCVRQILGHSSIRTTQIYIHVASEKLAQILSKMHPRNKMNIAGIA